MKHRRNHCIVDHSSVVLFRLPPWLSVQRDLHIAVFGMISHVVVVLNDISWLEVIVIVQLPKILPCQHSLLAGVGWVVQFDGFVSRNASFFYPLLVLRQQMLRRLHLLHQ